MLKIYYHLKKKIHIVKVYRLLNDELFRNLIIYRMVVLQLPVQSVLISAYEFESRTWRGVLDTTLCNTVC